MLNISPIPLNHLGMLKVSGPDAMTFLQGQLTTDMRALAPAAHQLSAFCNRQGRVLALMDIFRLEEDYFLIIPLEILDDIHTTLQKYIVFSKVKIENVSHTFKGLALLEDTKTPPDCLISFKSTPDAKATQYWGITTKMPDAGLHNDFLLAQMQARIPFIGSAQTGKFLPHYLGLIELRAIDFKKGCFVGQEIIARMEYRTEIKKHMIYCEIDKNDINPQMELVNQLSMTEELDAILAIIPTPEMHSGVDV